MRGCDKGIVIYIRHLRSYLIFAGPFSSLQLLVKTMSSGPISEVSLGLVLYSKGPELTSRTTVVL